MKGGVVVPLKEEEEVTHLYATFSTIHTNGQDWDVTDDDCERYKQQTQKQTGRGENGPRQ